MSRIVQTQEIAVIESLLKMNGGLVLNKNILCTKMDVHCDGLKVKVLRVNHGHKVITTVVWVKAM